MNAVHSRSDENSNTNIINDSNLLRFQQYLKLDKISGIAINSLKSTNVMYVNTSTECTQFDVNFTVLKHLHADMKISFPRITLFSNEIVDISKLRININDENIKREIVSCTNYLQRQRNINLALSILKKCIMLIVERKLIIEMLVLHSEAKISSEVHEDGGMVIRCEDNRSGFKFFESVWKMQFDCVEHSVSDFIDFAITVQDPTFHNKAKPAMQMLINPGVEYNKKVDLWWTIIQAGNMAIRQEVRVIVPHDPRDYLRVRSIIEINCADGEQYEIVESDDEDCIVIEDD